jgi:hypothetical protein
MGLNLRLSGHDSEPHETDIGSAHAFYLAAEWMRSLPAGEYPAVEAFARDGSYTGTDTLMLQMNDAALKYDPPSGGTGQIVELLMNRMGGGYPDETIQIVD